MVFLGLSEPRADELAVAKRTLDAVRQRFGQALVYARVDVVDGVHGAPLVLEIELIDPNLSLGIFPAAAGALANAVASRAAPRRTAR
jgi:hypothetical protein